MPQSWLAVILLWSICLIGILAEVKIISKGAISPGPKSDGLLKLKSVDTTL